MIDEIFHFVMKILVYLNATLCENLTFTFLFNIKNADFEMVTSSKMLLS